jgi:hypothetical protein
MAHRSTHKMPPRHRIAVTRKVAAEIPYSQPGHPSHELNHSWAPHKRHAVNSTAAKNNSMNVAQVFMYGGMYSLRRV